MCLCITENQKSDKSIPPVLLLKLENNVVFIDLFISVSSSAVYHHSFLSKLNELFSPHQCIALPKKV